MDDEYIIEEIEYVDYEGELNGIEIAEPSTSKNALTLSTAKSESMIEENLIEELIGGDITLSEYGKDGAELISDAESDPDDERPSTSAVAKLSARAIQRSPSASQSFENELDKSRKDAMRGLLQGRDELRNGRQRRRCVLPAALQGK